ncbi:hypothetical protein ACJBX3_10645, partial [Streptococcus suis]
SWKLVCFLPVISLIHQAIAPEFYNLSIIELQFLHMEIDSKKMNQQQIVSYSQSFYRKISTL